MIKPAAATFSLALLASLFVPRAFAQYHAKGDHAEVGIFGDYFRWRQGSIGLGGAGARVSFNIAPAVQLEGEAAYDFSQVFTEGFAAPSSGLVGFQRTNTRLVHGLFGPKLQTNVGPVRLFLTAKGGAMAFRFDPRAANFSTFTSTVEDLRADDVIASFYPGGGAEAFFGPLGLRFDAGDEMYFAGGAHHNLRLAFGPAIRF